MNEDFQNLIDTLKQVSLSGNEKREIKTLVFERISEKRESNRQFAEERYPYDIFAMFRSHALAFTTAMFVIFAGAGVSFGAENSLPGDPLYPVKIHINEGFRSAVVFNPIQEARWNSKRVERRLIEAQELAKEGRLEGEAEEIIEESFVSHTTEVYEAVNKIQNDQDIATALSLVSDLESLLSAHQEILSSKLAKRESAPEKPRTLKEFQDLKSDEEAASEEGEQAAALSGDDSATSSSLEESIDASTTAALGIENTDDDLTILDILESNIADLVKSRANIESRLSEVNNSQLGNSSLRAQRKSSVAISTFAKSIEKAEDVESATREGFEAEFERITVLHEKGLVEMDLGNYSKAITLFNQTSSAASKAKRLMEAHIELEVIKDTANEIEAQINGEALGSSTSTIEVGTTTEAGDLEGGSEEEGSATSTPEGGEEDDTESDEELDNESDEREGGGSKNTRIIIDLLARNISY